MPNRNRSDDISVRITLAAIHCAIEHGADASVLYRILGHPPDVDLSLFVPVATHFAVWEVAMRETRRPALPILAGQQRRTEHLQVRGFAALTALSGWEACEKAIEFAALTTTSVRWDLQRDDERDLVRVSVSRDGALSLGHRVSNECLLASTTTQMRHILGDSLALTQVTFRHAAPRDTATHEAFFRCPVTFSRDIDALVFEASALDRKPGNANAAMRDFFEKIARAQLAERDIAPESLASQVRVLIARALPEGAPKIRDIARQLAMSERSLRRGLDAESTRFAELLVDVRLTTAEYMLSHSDVSLNDVALRLGFSEHSSFTRFYRRHRGRPPSRGRAASDR